MDKVLSELPEELDQGRKSAFHGGALLIYRLHVIITEMNDLSSRGDFINWKRKLDTFYRELVWSLKDKEIQAREDLMKDQVIPALNNFMKLRRSENRVVARDAQDSAYVACAEYEIFLRKLQGRYGLVMPTSDDPRYAFKMGTR